MHVTLWIIPLDITDVIDILLVAIVIVSRRKK